MRFDLYTSEDRAREARARYLNEEREIYYSYASTAATILAIVALNLATVFSPDWIDLSRSLFYGVTSDWKPLTIIINYVLVPLITLRGFILFFISWTIFFAIQVYSIKFFAFSQGIMLGLLYGIAGRVLAYFGMLLLFDMSKDSLVLTSQIIGGITGIIVFIMAVFGAFLPAAR